MQVTDILMSDERSIFGSFKSKGETDSDAIYGHKSALLKAAKMFNITKYVCYFLASIPLIMFLLKLIFTGNLSIISLIFMILFIYAASLVKRSIAKKVLAIEAACKKYCESIGIEPV
jgi:hypothetical protein